jgi:hypothetical protein
MFKYISASRFLVSFIFYSLLLAVAVPATAQTRLYEVQLDVFEDNEILHSPSAIVEEGKSATITVGNNSIMLVVNSEGLMDARPVVSLALDIARFEDNTINELESTSIMAPTVFLPDTMKQGDPATVSIGSNGVAATVRRVEPSKVTLLMNAANRKDECQSANPVTLGDGDASIGDDDCCQSSCMDGSGHILTCCGAITCCDCGTCCSP